MKYSIRKAVAKDFAEILKLIKELAEFEKAEDQVINTVEQMIEEQDYFNCFVAETPDKKIIGMCLYYYVYYTWVGKSMYLDDLYVSASYRGKGIGSRLLSEIFEEAGKNGCKRLRWQVLDWNEKAINLYKKLGADIQKEWYNCDFNQGKINSISSEI